MLCSTLSLERERNNRYLLRSYVLFLLPDENIMHLECILSFFLNLLIFMCRDLDTSMHNRYNVTRLVSFEKKGDFGLRKHLLISTVAPTYQ